MPNSSDCEYFALRAEDERARAEASTDKQISTIHIELAERYERLVDLANGRRPLRVVSSS